MRSFRDRNQVVVGLTGLIAVAGLIVTVFAVGTLGLFDDTYELSAVFRGTGGIEKGADVRVAGVTVGAISGVHPDYETGQVILTFDVDSGVELGVDTEAEITAATLLGGYYLRLTGPVEEPYLEDLSPGDPRRRLPLEQTHPPASLVGTLGETTTAIQTLDLDAANAVLRDLAGATERNADLVPELVQSFSDIAIAIEAREGELRRLATSSAELTGTLAARDRELVALVDTATVLLDTLAARRDELATILGSGSAAVATLNQTITEHRASLDAVLADVHVLGAAIGDNIPVINESLGDAGTIFELLGRTIADDGGFDVGVEGLVVSADQLRSLVDLLIPRPTG